MHASSLTCEARAFEGSSPSRDAPSQLAVAWQHPVSRLISPTGLLDRESGCYRFRYIQNALRVPDFRPFVGFPELSRVYVSDALFPIFQQRVMSARRPDYEQYVARLGLPVAADSWEQLSRSGGRRVGDAIHLFPEPEVRADGRTETLFLIHGVRHVEEDIDSFVQRRIEKLEHGDELVLRRDTTNPYNTDALQVCAMDGGILGWVPNLLLDYFHRVVSGGSYRLSVEHVNDESAPYQFRLLARFSGWVDPKYRVFSGDVWSYLSEVSGS